MKEGEEIAHRKIIHIDMDAFYASVEQRDFPEYKGKPLAVGGSKVRGVVAAASYEARKYGVRSAMPSITAYRRCPEIIFVPPRFEEYKKVSQQIHEIFHRYTDIIEPLSLDEAFLDVSMNKIGLPSATLIAKEIKKAIYDELNLTASAGVSINKFVSKVASDVNKPNGIFVVGPSAVRPFIAQLPIEKFFGVGKVTAKKMKSHGIHFGSDLMKFKKHELVHWFGKSGNFFYNICRGIDNRAVNPNHVRKSIGVETTFQKDLFEQEDLIEVLQDLSKKAWQRCEKSNKIGRTVTVKFKFNDFSQITRSKTQSVYFNNVLSVENTVIDILKQEALALPVRLMGVTISGFQKEPDEGTQLTLHL